MVMLFTWQSIICEWNQGQSARVDLFWYPLRLVHQHHSLLEMNSVIQALVEDYISSDRALVFGWSTHGMLSPSCVLKTFQPRGIELPLSDERSLSSHRIQIERLGHTCKIRCAYLYSCSHASQSWNQRSMRFNLKNLVLSE